MIIFARCYDHTPDSPGLFCRALLHQPSDEQKGRQQHLLSCQPSSTMVYGSLRHDRSQHFWCHFHLSPRDGAHFADDLSADVSWLHRGLSGDSICIAAAILPPESHKHLHLSGTASRFTLLHHWSQLLPTLEDDWSSREILCRMHHPPAVRVRSCRHPLRRKCAGNGIADMALHPSRRHRHAGIHRFFPDALSLHSPHPDHPFAHQRITSVCW